MRPLEKEARQILDNWENGTFQADKAFYEAEGIMDLYPRKNFPVIAGNEEENEIWNLFPAEVISKLNDIHGIGAGTLIEDIPVMRRLLSISEKEANLAWEEWSSIWEELNNDRDRVTVADIRGWPYMDSNGTEFEIDSNLPKRNYKIFTFFDRFPLIRLVMTKLPEMKGKDDVEKSIEIARFYELNYPDKLVFILSQLKKVLKEEFISLEEININDYTFSSKEEFRIWLQKIYQNMDQTHKKLHSRESSKSDENSSKSSSTKTFLIGPPYKDRAQTKKAIDAGIIAAYFFGGMAVLVGLAVSDAERSIGGLLLVMAGIALHRWKSRTAAILLLLFSLLDALSRAVLDHEGYLVSIILFYCACKAIKGTFYWHDQHAKKEISVKS